MNAYMTINCSIGCSPPISISNSKRSFGENDLEVKWFIDGYQCLQDWKIPSLNRNYQLRWTVSALNSVKCTCSFVFYRVGRIPNRFPNNRDGRSLANSPRCTPFYSISALALSAIPAGGMHDIAIFRDRYRNTSIIWRLISVIAFPSGTIVGFQDMSILGNFDGNTLIYRCAMGQIAFPTWV